MASRLPVWLRHGFSNTESARSAVAQLLPGLCMCIVIVLAAHYVADNFGGPIILLALVMGMILRHVANYKEFVLGLDFASTYLLRLGIALLGIKITLTQISSLGIKPLVLLLSVPLTILLSILMARLLGVSRAQGVVAGCSVGICGVAAAVAVSSVLPDKKEQQTYLVCLLLGVTGISSVVMLLYPALNYFAHWPSELAGLFLGATIHDVAHVAASGYMMSEATGDIAIYMKMLRVAALVPVVLVVAWLVRKKQPAMQANSAFPLFLLGFVLIALINNVVSLPSVLQETIANGSSLCLLLAMVAIGVKVNFSDLVKIGKRAFALLVFNTTFLALYCGVVIAA